MARSKKQFLQNVHTTKMYSPEVIAGAELKDGEIAVFQNTKQPSLGIKVGDNTYAQFKDSEAVTAEITSAKDELSATISENTTKIGQLEAKFGDYATTGALATAKTELTADYDGKFTAIKGEGYTSGTTLKSLSDAIDLLKGDSDTTVEAVASRVTVAEGKITALEEKVGDDTKGLVKNVADLKTTVGDSTTGLVKNVADLNKKIDAVSGASSAYTDSQINAIKGTSYKEGTTLASLESNLGTEKRRIDAILQDAPEDLHSFKDVDTKITNAITAAYKYQGSVNNYDDLPESGKTTGYVYNVVQAVGTPGTADYTPAGTNYAWNGTTWDALGGTVDLSTYATTATTKRLESRLDTAEANIDTLTAATGTLNTSITTIQGWKINGTAITSDTVLTGENVKVSTSTTAQSLNEAIADAKEAGTTAQTNLTTLKGSYSGTLGTLSDKVDANEQKITQLRTDVNGVSAKTITAVQTITVTNTETNKITATKAEGSTNVVLNFDNMVIDCGEF